MAGHPPESSSPTFVAREIAVAGSDLPERQASDAVNRCMQDRSLKAQLFKMQDHPDLFDSAR
jgi:hypothetical protein